MMSRQSLCTMLLCVVSIDANLLKKLITVLIGNRYAYARGGGFSNGMIGGGFSESESDISFISSERASTDRASSVMYDYMDRGRLSTSSDQSFGSMRLGPKFAELNFPQDFSSVSHESSRTSSSWSSQNLVSNQKSQTFYILYDDCFHHYHFLNIFVQISFPSHYLDDFCTAFIKLT